MPSEHPGDPWWGTTYKGFSGASSGRPPAPARARPGGRTLLIGGVVAALALGAVFGLLARPQLVTPTAADAPMQPRSAAPAAQVPIAVNPPPNPPPAKAAEPLEVLPPDMAQAAPRPARPAAGGATAAAPLAEAPPPSQSPAEPASVGSPPPALSVEAVPPPPAPGLRASFDCATARPGAEQMVCSDPALAAADRQLASAYRRAVRSGAPAADLRVEQRDWLAIREEAARRSPRALAGVYDQRIQELNEIADNGYGPD